MKYNYYVYLPRIGTILTMMMTCIGLWSKPIIFNLIYLIFVVIFAQACFIFEKKLLKKYEPQFNHISFRDSLLMYPILLKIELFLFGFVSVLSLLLLLCVTKKMMALITLLMIAIITSLYLNLPRH